MPQTYSDQPIDWSMRLAHRLARYTTVTRRPVGAAGPLVSVTFDDVPESAVANGARLLEAHGWRGTFYAATSLFGQRTAHWQVAPAETLAALARSGHEIGLHTHLHRPVVKMGRRAFAEDLVRSRDILAGLVPRPTPRNFAYPYGFGSPLHKAILRSRVRSSRTTRPGVNGPTFDPHMLRSTMLDAHTREPAAIDALIDEARARQGWLILTTHDVAENPSPYGCTPALLAHALDAIERRGIPVLTVDAALDRMGAA